MADSLRTPEPLLVTSRHQFIQTLDRQRQFEEECAVIIPELTRLWHDKILMLLYDNHTGGVIIPTDETHDIAWQRWKHFLFNYSPQLLSKGITRLASRIHMKNGEPNNSRGKIENVAAYYKAIVQDLRRQEIRKQTANAEAQAV